MDFVVHVLKKYFRKNEAEATEIMFQVHHNGSGLAGIYTFEIAETKVFQVNDYAKKNHHPLKCIYEKETEDTSKGDSHAGS
jgi:ATP-dependent Clp protease adaptor protein ClpS